MSDRPSLWQREPLAVVLIGENLLLVAGLLLYVLSGQRPAAVQYRPDDVAAGGGMPAGMASSGGPMSGPMGGGMAQAADAAGAQTAEVQMGGKVKLGAGKKLPAGAHVFIIAKAAGGGPPFAVRRYDDVVLPLDWSLTGANVMIAGVPAPDKIQVSARIDQDGDAMTRQAGDLESAPSKPIAVVGGKADLVCDKDTKPAAGRPVMK
jgi:hypothetical protein